MKRTVYVRGFRLRSSCSKFTLLFSFILGHLLFSHSQFHFLFGLLLAPVMCALAPTASLLFLFWPPAGTSHVCTGPYGFVPVRRLSSAPIMCATAHTALFPVLASTLLFCKFGLLRELELYVSFWPFVFLRNSLILCKVKILLL